MEKIEESVNLLQEFEDVYARIFIGQLLTTTPRHLWETQAWSQITDFNSERRNSIAEESLKSIFDSIGKVLIEKEDADRKRRNELRESLRNNKKQTAYDIATYLIERYNIKTVGNRENSKEMYVYAEGVYKIDSGFIKKEILDITMGNEGSHVREEILKVVKEKTHTERHDFEIATRYINLKNGIFDVTERKFLYHDPRHLFLHQIPVRYDPDASCPTFTGFLNQILDEDSIKIVQEWFGYCLYRDYFCKKALILLGGRDTGKTTLLRVLERFLGRTNVSGVSLQKLSSDKFALSNLFNKHANIYDDLSFKDINDNGTFKMLTGGGTVTGEKKFGDMFPFKNYAKITFSCNKIPSIKDSDDDAYFSRWILIRFEHATTTPDKFLVQKMSTDREMSGVFNFALEGLFRLLENQGFSFTQTPEEVKKDMCASGSSVAQFAYSQLEASTDKDAYITKDIMEQEFVKYAMENDLPAGLTKEGLGKKLPKFLPIASGRRNLWNTSKGKIDQIPCWIGVKFKNPAISPIPEQEEQSDKEIDIFDFDT